MKIEPVLLLFGLEKLPLHQLRLSAFETTPSGRGFVKKGHGVARLISQRLHVNCHLTLLDTLILSLVI